MNVKVYKSNNIEVGDLVDFNGDRQYHLIISYYHKETGLLFGLLDVNNNRIKQKLCNDLNALIKEKGLTLVAKKDELNLICGKGNK